MKKIFYLSYMLIAVWGYSQVGINTESPNPKAVLELKSNANNIAKGFMLTRLNNAEMSAMNLTTTDEGMVIYNKEQKKFFGWDGTAWQNLGYEESNTVPYLSSTPKVMVLSNNQKNAGDRLTALHSVSDVDAEDIPNLGSTIVWKKADDNTGTNTTDISGETNISYLVSVADVGKYLQSCVTPISSSGSSPGVQQCSSWFGPIELNLPTVQFSSVSSSVLENVGTSQTITLQLSESSLSPVSVKVAIKLGASTTGDAADIDNYTTQLVTFNPGEMSKDISITITNDTLYEDDEQIVFELIDATNSVEGIVNEYTLTIQNDDPIDCTVHGAARLNEFVYDSEGTDDEWVEIRIADPQPPVSCLNQFKIISYKPDGTVKGNYTFGSPSSTGSSAGYKYYVIHPGSNSLQNSGGAIGFIAPNNNKELVSWEGVVNVPASDTDFGGETSVDVGVVQSNAQTTSVSRDASGNWSLDTTPTEGTENN